MELPKKLDFNNPTSDRMTEDNINSLIVNIKKALLVNHTIDSDMCDITQKVIDKVVPKEIEQYNIVEENYDDIGNTLVKLINLGYSVGVDEKLNGDARLKFSTLFDPLKMKLKYTLVDKKAKIDYKGAEILHHSVLASQPNINQMLGKLKEDTEYDYIKYKDWFIIIFSRAYLYGYAASSGMISAYKMELFKADSTLRKLRDENGMDNDKATDMLMDIQKELYKVM